MSQLATPSQLQEYTPGPRATNQGAVSVPNLVGNTPLLRLSHITAHLPASVEVYAKAEWYNPSGSVKDRPALNIIRTALASGQLTPEKVLLALHGNKIRVNQPS